MFQRHLAIHQSGAVQRPDEVQCKANANANAWQAIWRQAKRTASIPSMISMLALSTLLTQSTAAYAAAPTVSVTAPSNNTKLIAPASLTITANATNDASATITKVEFYRGTTLLGTDTTAPYSYSWSNVAAGTYSITAKATNSLNQVTTSAAVSLIVNNLPTVSLTAPANNSSVAGKASISLTATASDSGGSIAKVEFFNGASLLATDTTSPYSYNWTNVAPGTYSITAKATDNRGDTKTTAVTTVTVTNPVTTSMTAPANNSVAALGSPITINANASTSKSGATISKVEFYQGATLIGTDTTLPYSISWNGAAAGTYSLTSKATDSQGLVQTSSPITVTVQSTLPSVSITSPSHNSNHAAPANLQLTANASAIGAGNSITKVEYFQGASLIGTANTAPYTISWNNAPAGLYSITAKATDNTGQVQTSQAVAVRISTPPSISLTSPLANANFIAPGKITLTSAPVANEAGTTISKVEYFENTTLVATATAAPFTATWDNVVAGSYSLTAKVTDSNNHSTSSAPVAITVINNTAPTVSLTANPSNGTAPATIIVTATATDTDGTISKVELFNGASLLTTLTTAPYTYLWENVAAGSYTLTAKATDNLDKATTSSEVPVTVVAHVPKIYDIHTDHLSTPRMVTDSSGNKVWEWSGTPFGESLPNQNPNNTGAQNDFTLNLRFPGQVFDRETGLHYNYFRDYDPSTGRYVQSDPIGLLAGVNTFGYVGGNPVSSVDPSGLEISVPGGRRLPGPFDVFIPGTPANNNFVITTRRIIQKIEELCEEKKCSPPAGTQCYMGPDTTHSHGGLDTHYHIFQMFQFRGTCQWKYLGGKVGKGVLAMPPDGMLPCSSYPGFQGR